MAFREADLSRDQFLGGALSLWQPKAGYRAGIDPVLLAASVRASAGDHVLDLGCGAGAALFCLGRRVPELELHGLEIQPDYADLARKNAVANDLSAEIHLGDVAAVPKTLTALSFDHVLANPPYYPDGSTTRAQDAGRAMALSEDAPLRDWVEVAYKRLKPKGYCTFIQRADRLVDLLVAYEPFLGSIRIRPIAARVGRSAALVIVSGRKDGKAAPVLDPPLVLHASDAHRSDRKDYRPEIEAVLWDGKSLPEAAN